MADKHDPNLWESIGIAITGLLTGAGAMFATKRRSRSVTENRVRGDIRKLQDTVLIMSKDIQTLQESVRAQEVTTDRLEQDHNNVISELFKEMREMNLVLRELKTQVRIFVEKKGIE